MNLKNTWLYLALIFFGGLLVSLFKPTTIIKNDTDIKYKKNTGTIETKTTIDTPKEIKVKRKRKKWFKRKNKDNENKRKRN